MMKYGTSPPNRLPPTFSGAATFTRFTSNGRATVAGSPRAASSLAVVLSRSEVKNASSWSTAMLDLISPW
jgi:hypothetical protein